MREAVGMPIRALVAWPLAALAVAWAVVRLLGLERGFPLVAIVSWTPWAVAAAMVVAVLAGLLRQRAAALLALLAALVLAVVVAPRALGGASEAEGGNGPPLRVMTANMYGGQGSPRWLVRTVARERPDVLSVQELTPGLEQELAAAGLEAVLPHAVLATAPEADGMGLYSRVPLQPLGDVPDLSLPVPAGRLLMPGGTPVEVFAVHLTPPVADAQVRRWREDLRRIPPATRDGPVRILAGDFNATIDHAEFRRVLDTGYEDAAAVVGAGLRWTWPDRRVAPPVTIDHVLADRRVGVREVEVLEIPGSDHSAVLAEIVLPRG
jgi:endonuclease/exonuclease/phosphatase (EEP) superfamily protein YafD